MRRIRLMLKQRRRFIPREYERIRTLKEEGRRED